MCCTVYVVKEVTMYIVCYSEGLMSTFLEMATDLYRVSYSGYPPPTTPPPRFQTKCISTCNNISAYKPSVAPESTRSNLRGPEF